MAIKRYFSNSDNTITSAFKPNLRTRGTNANMGAADILETFSIYGQASSASTELQRILINFPISEIISDRATSKLPGAGSVNFYLNLYNAPHSQTVPRHLGLSVYAISSSWEEGTGLDMEDYKDIVLPGDIGSTWESASNTTAWTREGGDYHASPVYNQAFDKGTENLSINVTSLVEEWIAGTKNKYGFGVHVTSSQEAYFSGSAGTDTSAGQLNNLSGSKTSYYTKKFFGRNSEFFFKRPTIEARWNSSEKDDRGNFYASSSLLPPSENTRSLFLYNSIGGRLYDIPAIGTNAMFVKIFDAASGGSQVGTTITSSWSSKGVYGVSFILDTAKTTVYDRWYDTSFTNCYSTGTIRVKQHESQEYNPYPSYVTSLTNLRSTYYPHETSRFRFYVREKDWCPTIYNVANKTADTLTIESASYQIHRVVDDLKVIPFGTGSENCTELSFDMSGNYFDLDMGLFEPGYSYGIKVAFYSESVNSYVEQPYEWKFRVENLETQ